MKFVVDDGGRAAAGFKGSTRDCVARAIAIASGRPYLEIYDALNARSSGERQTVRTRRDGRRQFVRGSSARDGVLTSRKWFREYMQTLGFRWVATMRIGSGCTVHLHDGELPAGRLVVSVSRHLTAVIDGVVHDTHDPQRATLHYHGAELLRISRRCVYGYWILEASA